MNKRSRYNYFADVDPSFIIGYKELLRQIVLYTGAGLATIAPPLGPTLGQFGINITDFCKQFNERSKNFDPGVLLLVRVNLYKNKSFTFLIQPIPITFLVNEANHYLDEDVISAFINLSDILKILQGFGLLRDKFDDRAFFKELLGTMRSMHIRVCNDLEDKDIDKDIYRIIDTDSN